jgi:hypothetical protein
VSEARQKAEEILEDVFEFSDCNDRRTFQKGSFTHTRLIDIIASLLEEQVLLRDKLARKGARRER